MLDLTSTETTLGMGGGGGDRGPINNLPHTFLPTKTGKTATTRTIDVEIVGGLPV